MGAAIFLLLFSIGLIVDGILFMTHSLVVVGLIIIIIGISAAIFSKYVAVAANHLPEQKPKSRKPKKETVKNQRTMKKEQTTPIIEPMTDEQTPEERLSRLIQLKKDKSISKQEYNQRRKEIISKL